MRFPNFAREIFSSTSLATRKVTRPTLNRLGRWRVLLLLFSLLFIRLSAQVQPSERVLYHSTQDSLYRIPALASTNGGTLIAISDYRYSHGYDVGFGRPIDVLYRLSQDQGKTWSEPRLLADCHNADYGRNIYGFGDACIVADRESSEVVVMCVGDSLGKSYPERGKLEVYQFRSFDGGQTWTEVCNLTPQFYEVNPAWESLFVASGRIFQSRVVKRGRYYRLYCAALVGGFGNAVFYSDDLGRHWQVLGDVLHSPCPEGDEAKTEELPDGTVILSCRTEGRYFNLFRYDNDDYASGQWTGVHKAEDIRCEGNATNGEILGLKVQNPQTQAEEWLYFQSVPAGPGRSHVSIYYKIIPQQPSYREMTAQDFGLGWNLIEITDQPSAYSTLCLLDASHIAILYERLGEHVNGYEVVLGKWLIDSFWGKGTL